MNGTALNLGDIAPDFRLPDKSGKEVSLKDYVGKWVVIYMYPKDNTPGCTLEAQDFTRLSGEFEKRGAMVLGISPDSPASHEKFCMKFNLTVTLLSDPEHAVIDRYGSWVLKKQYGREFHGVVRSTFLVDPEGKIRSLWPKVTVKGHAEEVLEKLDELSL